MVSTPKISNKILTSETDQNKQSIDPTSINNNNSKVNIMLQDFGQYFEMPQTKSGAYDINSLDEWFANDLSNFLKKDYIFPAENPEYDVSQLAESSMTTPSLVFDNPQELEDSPLFSSIPAASFSGSSPLEPALAFFPDLTNSNVAATVPSSFMQHLSITPSVTIPADDSSSLTSITGGSALSPALNIPWSDMTGSSSTDDLFQNSSSGSPSLLSTLSNPIPASPKPSSNVASPLTMSPSITSTPVSPSPLTNKSTTRGRKRSIDELEKDPQLIADELAMKRAKNTDAARRSRLRKVMKMESLEKQVSSLKTENNDLQTRIAVLESEKKGLEDKNAEKDARVKMLEQQLSEAHERLIKRT